MQRLKARCHFNSPKTVNTVLEVLNVLFKAAVEWDVSERLPCAVKLLPVTKGWAAFSDCEGTRG